MISDVSADYQIIAEALAQSAPAGWQKAWVNSKVDDGVSENTFDYQKSDGSEYWFDPESVKVAVIGRAIRKIRDQMAIPGQKPWSRCTFTLYPDGKFKFDVEYDD
jgi:Protein of unknown function, DUF600